MKRLNSTERSLIIFICLIIIIFGKKGLDFLGSINRLIPIYELAFVGLISFGIVAIIMFIADKYFDFWFGKKGGAILYAAVCIIVGIIFF